MAGVEARDPVRGVALGGGLRRAGGTRTLSGSLLALAAAACGGAGDSAETTIAFEEIAKSSVSGISAPTTVVVGDVDAWADLWRRHSALVVPPPPLPPVDFSREQVVAVFLGPRPNGCHAVAIVGVLQGRSTRVVDFREQVPDPTAICTMQVVTPAHLVKIPAGTDPIEFRGP